MRLWTLDPTYLDQKGLCGLWREGIMAINALTSYGTHKYYNHPQLDRFKEFDGDYLNLGVGYLMSYMVRVYNVGKMIWKFNFDRDKLHLGDDFYVRREIMNVTTGQVEYEAQHLIDKLFKRNNDDLAWKLNDDLQRGNVKLNPIFTMIDGPIESWEKI